jgi:GAF domain-containing protein
MPVKALEKLKAGHRFLKLRISREEELQHIVSLAAKICGTPTALITLLGEDTQYIRFKQAFDLISTARVDAFCNHVIQGKDVMVVPDAMQDTRFHDNPVVNEEPGIRFYAFPESKKGRDQHAILF